MIVNEDDISEETIPSNLLLIDTPDDGGSGPSIIIPSEFVHMDRI